MEDVKPLLSNQTWAKIKSGAAVVGLTLGTIGLCAISTFACAYAHGYGCTRGFRDGQESKNGGPPNRGNPVPIGRSYERSVFDDDD